MYTPWKQRPKQSLKVKLTIFFSSFFRTLFSHPSSKRLESRREAEPALPPFKVLFVCLLYTPSQLTRKRSKAVGCCKRQMYKKIKILQKLTSTKRGFFYPFSSASRHGPLISQKNFANWNDRNYTSFLPSHELEVTFEQTNKLPALFIFPPTIHNW